MVADLGKWPIWESGRFGKVADLGKWPIWERWVIETYIYCPHCHNECFKKHVKRQFNFT